MDTETPCGHGLQTRDSRKMPRSWPTWLCPGIPWLALFNSSAPTQVPGFHNPGWPDPVDPTTGADIRSRARVISESSPSRVSHWSVPMRRSLG